MVKLAERGSVTTGLYFPFSTFYTMLQLYLYSPFKTVEWKLSEGEEGGEKMGPTSTEKNYKDRLKY